MTDFDYVLVGGGLQSGLIALALLSKRPDVRLAIVERGDRLGGNHTWCFHAGDLEPSLEQSVGELVVRRWDGYEVAFPKLERRLDEPYALVTSERLASVVSARLCERQGSALLLGRSAVALAEREVVLDDATRLNGRFVIDARGPDRFSSSGAVGYQKFHGLELELDEPSRLERPLLMDARVAQHDGFRFMYVLPLAPDRVLIEDTFFSDHASLERERLEASVLAHARASGLRVRRVIRREHGVLPLPLRAELAPPGWPLRAGYLGGWFHPTTGYSFPVAARLAALIADSEPAELDERLARAWALHARQLRFACFLNRLLFAACAPDQRVNVLERFYRLPAPAIRRFYALNTTGGDRARIVCGRPPRGVSIAAAISHGVLS